MAFANRKLQDALRVAHLWLGIAAGLFIVMMGLSGTVIVFRSQIEASVAPKTAHEITAASSLSAVAKSLDMFRPGARITHITFPDTADGPLLVQADSAGQKHMLLYFDPSTGRVLGEKPTLAWLDWLVDLHQNLLSGKTGRAWAGLIGAALLLVSASGLFSWLAGSRDWKRTLAVPRKGPWRRVNFQAHKWAGLWCNVLLIVVSFTGMVLAWPDAFHSAGPPTLAKVEGRSRKSLLLLDNYVRAATAALPGGVVRELRLPGRGSNVVSLTVRLSGDLRRKGGNIVLLDPVSAKVISVERASAAPFSVRFVELANAIHKTELGGLPVQLAWSLLGLAPALLFVSGLGIWWQRRSARKVLAPTAKPAMARRIETAAGQLR